MYVDIYFPCHVSPCTLVHKSHCRPPRPARRFLLDPVGAVKRFLLHKERQSRVTISAISLIFQNEHKPSCKNWFHTQLIQSAFWYFVRFVWYLWFLCFCLSHLHNYASMPSSTGGHIWCCYSQGQSKCLTWLKWKNSLAPVCTVSQEAFCANKTETIPRIKQYSVPTVATYLSNMMKHWWHRWNQAYYIILYARFLFFQFYAFR